MASHRKLRLPLPPGFFHRPPLDPADVSALIEDGLGTLTTALRLVRRKGGPVAWSPLESVGNVCLYAGENPCTKSDATMLYMATTEIYATLDEAAALLDTTTPAKYRHVNSTFSKDILDCCILYDLAMPTPEYPRNYLGVKWCAVEISTPLVKNRDFCLLECSDDFVLNGRRGWARVYRSIEMPSACPDMQSSLDLVRGQVFLGGHIFTESATRPGYLDVTQLVQSDGKGSVPHWAVHMSMKSRTKALVGLHSHFQRHRLSHAAFLNANDVVQLGLASACGICHLPFTRFRAKKNCRKCGDVVCTKCSKHWDVTVAGTTPHRVFRVCHRCVMEVSDPLCSMSQCCLSARTTSDRLQSLPRQPLPPQVPRLSYSTQPPGAHDANLLSLTQSSRLGFIDLSVAPTVQRWPATTTDGAGTRSSESAMVVTFQKPIPPHSNPITDPTGMNATDTEEGALTSTIAVQSR